MLQSHGKSRVGTVHGTALMQPFISPRSPHKRGVLAGRIRMTGDPLFFDPFYGMAREDASTKQYNFYGDLRVGKSAAMKMLARRMSLLQAFDGVDDAHPTAFRMWITDRKMNEYRRLTKDRRGTIIDMNGEVKFNPFDEILSGNELHMVDIAMNLMEIIKGKPLDGYEPLIVQVAVYMMLKNTTVHRPSVASYFRSVFNMTVSDLADYYTSTSMVLDEAVDESIPESMVERIKPLSSVERIGAIIPDDFQAARGRVQVYAGLLKDGPMSSVFGGDTSMFDQLTSRCSNIIWHDDINLIAQDAAEAILAKWSYISRSNPALIKATPHLKIGDEAGKGLARSPISLRFTSEALRDARAIHTAGLMATQYPQDITSAGGNDPKLMLMAQAINNAVAGRIIFRLPPTDENMDAMLKWGLSEVDASRVTRQPPHCAVLLVTGRPPVFFQTIATPSDLKIIYSDEETDKMVDKRQHALDDPEMVRRANAMGYFVPGALEEELV